MLYTVNVDEKGWVLSIANTENDDIELDLEGLDLHYITAYQLVDGELVLNEAKRKALETLETVENKKPTWQEEIEAQVVYTALMTDTLLGG